MAATASEAIMIELEKEGCEWIRSERFEKRKAEEAKNREKNNPMKLCVLKFDHFENIHRLDKKLPVFDGAPNFRQVPGYLVFGTGQPTKDGFLLTLKYISEAVQASHILWTNMRQEPVVYLNGQSFTPRLPDRMNENMEFPGISGDDIEWLQEQFVKSIKDKVDEVKKDRYTPDEEKGLVRYYRDTYAEHPEDRKNIEYSVHLDNEEDLITLGGLYSDLKQSGFSLQYARMPIIDEKAPTVGDFDALLEMLRVADDNTACVFNCQMGKGRTTTGMVIACLIKDIVHGHNKGKEYIFRQVDRNEIPDEEEALEEEHRLGNYVVLDKLYQYLPEARTAKAHLDHILDLCGEPATGGTGLQNLRECIQWAETKFNFEPKNKKAFWRQMGQNFIERYCYLILFTAYLQERAPREFDINFSLWLDIRAEMREIVAQGTKSFNWN
ncbi:paladin isoform X2 [Eurytemora carolleeae]|uniref:paladin isoform X2 n=1 Tax=Eurytemora carolleeae TaxID=1294199 RepID=UPI000C7919C2|nr:paladin isoform X2 [Eurytemora carolleeae]|eukprot:XP_023341623.1 paladin-like isoform X2 [Eurytemora affinis]